MSGYCATKYAVEGLVESLLYEVHCFGIKATLVEPGHVKDDDERGYIVSKSQEEEAAMARESHKGPGKRGKKQLAVGPAPETHPPPTDPTPPSPSTSGPPIRQYSHFLIHPHPSPSYKSPTHPSGHAQRVFTWLGRRQPTSAVRSAELVWQLAHCAYPPLRLLLGEYAVESVRDRLKCVTEEIEDWKFLGFAEGGAGRGSAGREGEGEDEEMMDGEGQEDVGGESEEFEDEEDAEEDDEDGLADVDVDVDAHAGVHRESR